MEGTRGGGKEKERGVMDGWRRREREREKERER